MPDPQSPDPFRPPRPAEGQPFTLRDLVQVVAETIDCRPANLDHLLDKIENAR
ncbi:hypothetical protein [Phaeovulum vinaykumarii]|uniref:Uncharacterized protein n=1 Tax=Phaeovulum vinaykumarii TaxID=407234 RepID=A0A1N7K3A7_9RHOB|nr:hypothetical protein [Phaeovulum vinaykumarii]SIS56085.1 hypothetical protein SAMN05421795_101579 [Phaeovulum vinaykumarii]SOB92699.1 hypothetical protein SAMN05878426_101577 [Phaeovulum vinaykumarii]